MVAATPVCAESVGQISELTDALALAGSLRTSYWSSGRTLDDREHLGVAAAWLRMAPRLTPHVSLFAEAWVMGEDVFGQGKAEGRLREAYLALRLGPVDVWIGKQIIVWGRADRINPTDKLTPRDFTLLVPEDDDQRFGTTGVRATYFRGNLAVTGIWLADAEPDVVPIRPLPSPLVLRDRRPAGTLGQGAVRIDVTGKGLDWSLSYFDGFDRLPDLGLGRAGGAGIGLTLTPHRIRVLGGDIAMSVGPYGLRAEAAYTFTEDGRGDDPYIKNPFFFLVAGADRTFAQRLNINVQYIFRIVGAYRDPLAITDPLARAVAIEAALLANQLDRVQHSVSVRLGHHWLNETLHAELASIVSAPRLGFVLRPRLTYALSDRWHLSVGGDVFGGDRLAFLGHLRKNSTGFVEFRWSF